MATMKRSQREAFLADVHVGVLSIARTGRGPLAVPIWYDYEPGGDVSMITSEGSLKRALLMDVCLLYTSPSPRDQLQDRFPDAS